MCMEALIDYRQILFEPAAAAAAEAAAAAADNGLAMSAFRVPFGTLTLVTTC